VSRTRTRAYGTRSESSSASEIAGITGSRNRADGYYGGIDLSFAPTTPKRPGLRPCHRIFRSLFHRFQRQTLSQPPLERTRLLHPHHVDRRECGSLRDVLTTRRPQSALCILFSIIYPFERRFPHPVICIFLSLSVCFQALSVVCSSLREGCWVSIKYGNDANVSP
jgi:hypothetical protein